MMRLAIVATPAYLPDLRPAPGALDGDVIRSRLPLSDTDFRVVDLDPAVDLAEQLETFFEHNPVDKGTAVLFYASSTVALSAEGELFLCLDPTSIETGDSLRDIALVFQDCAPGPIAFVIECRHSPDSEDPFASATIVAACKEALASTPSRIEVLVAARPLADEPDERPSPLTRVLIESLDDADPQIGLTLARFFEEVRERLVGVVPAFAHVRGRKKFFLLPLSDPDAVVDSMQSSIPAPPLTQEAALPEAPTAEPEAPAAEPEAFAAPPAEPRAEPEEPRAEPEEPAPPKVLVKLRSSPPPPSDEAALPRVIVAERPPPAAPPPSVPPPPAASDHVAAGDALLLEKDAEGALAALKRALAMLGPKDATERGEIYLRMGKLKELQEKRREAIASYEKALQLIPAHPHAVERLVDLNVVEGDLRGLAVAEDRLLATLADEEARFPKLIEYGARWEAVAEDLEALSEDERPAERALVFDRRRAIYERARAIHPDDLAVLAKLRGIYEKAGAIDDAFTTRRRIADLTTAPRDKAEQYQSLAKYCLHELKEEDLALELFDLALESDPTLLEPLTVVARFFAERQEWSELERAYRKMLERAQRIERPAVRSQVTWELCQRLGLLFRDHLEDPALALDAFEDAVAEKKNDIAGRLTAAELARSIGRHDRAAIHLQSAATLDPTRVTTFHDLFDTFQKLRRPDLAYAAAQITMYLGKAEARERFIFEEHRPTNGVPKLVRVMREDGWDLLRVRDREPHLGLILASIERAAQVARIAELTEEGKLPVLNPAARQDPQKTTVSIVRSFAWASHFLGVAAPAIYLHDDETVGLAAVISDEEASVAGGRVLRGRSTSELAFIAARHLAYHVGAHRLLLYYPSLEELSACFLAALKIILPELPLPANVRKLALDLRERISAELSEEEHADLEGAVKAFQAAGGRADITAWVADVERCASRAGYLLSGDLDVAATVLHDEPGGVVSVEDQIADLLGFAVSDEHSLLREELGVAVQP